MSKGLITHVVVGADRITANGDVANKIGTYTVSVLAREHGVPFYVAAPFSTVDLVAGRRRAPSPSRSGRQRRSPASAACAGRRSGVKVRNPAFDVTPARNITAIITDRGVAYARRTSDELWRRLEAT